MKISGKWLKIDIFTTDHYEKSDMPTK